MIVSNATPLIAFSRLNRLELLREVLGGKLVVPEAVAEEVSQYRVSRAGRAGIDLEHETWIEVQAVEDTQRVELLLPTLDRGEAEVIALALEKKANLVLLDELIGRRVAQSLELAVTGSVGILIRAKEKGAIIAVTPLLEEMIEQGVHFSRRFVDRIVRHLGE